MMLLLVVLMTAVIVVVILLLLLLRLPLVCRHRFFILQNINYFIFFFNSFNITNFFRGCCCCHNCYCLLFVSKFVFFSFFFEFHEMCFWLLSSVSVDLDKFILTKRTYTNGDGGILDSIRCATKWISFHFILIYTRERLCILEYSCVCSVSSISENTHLHTYTMYVQSTAAAVAVAAATMVYSQQAACIARIISCRNKENRFFKGL